MNVLSRSNLLTAVAEAMMQVKGYLYLQFTQQRGEEVKPQQYLVRARFSSFTRPSHLEILDLTILFLLNVHILQIKIYFGNLPTLGKKIWNLSNNFLISKKMGISSINDVVQISISISGKDENFDVARTRNWGECGMFHKKFQFYFIFR